MCVVCCDECAAEIGALKDADSFWDLPVNIIDLPNGDFFLCNSCLKKMTAYYTERLLACPFCGDSAEFNDAIWDTNIAIQCSNGCNKGRIWVTGTTLFEVVRMWNFRDPTKWEILYPPLQKKCIKFIDYSPLNCQTRCIGKLTLCLIDPETSSKTYFTLDNPLIPTEYINPEDSTSGIGPWRIDSKAVPEALKSYFDRITVLVNMRTIW